MQKFLKKSRLSSAKAKMMLKDNSAQGNPLTEKQKHLFQAVAHGFKPTKTRTMEKLKRGMKGYKK